MNRFLKKVVHVKFTNFLPGSQGKNKDGKLELHFSSDSHLSSLKRYLNFKNGKNNIDYMLYANMQQHEQLKIQVAKSNQNVAFFFFLGSLACSWMELS